MTGLLRTSRSEHKSIVKCENHREHGKAPLHQKLLLGLVYGLVYGPDQAAKLECCTVAIGSIWGSHCDAAFLVSPNGRLKASAGILVSLYALPTCECLCVRTMISLPKVQSAYLPRAQTRDARLQLYRRASMHKSLSVWGTIS